MGHVLNMITVKINQSQFEYDIHSLVKAFYPGEDVVVCVETDEDVLAKIEIFFEEDRIRMRMENGTVWESPLGEDRSRSAVRNVLKTLLYRMLSDRTGKQLPWGDLTGIRPTKIPMDLLDEGWSNPQIAKHMREKYFVSPDRCALAITIANRERALLEKVDYKNGYSLYVGIPFCPSICLYCSFSSSPLSLYKDRVDDYLGALFKEIEECAHLMDPLRLNTVYIGGGTPTTLTPPQMDALLAKLEECFPISSVSEFTVEAGRPDTITRDILEVLREHGIGRISINPQTMNQKTLDLIGRRHSVEQIVEAFHLARELGFSNINMDLIVGLPGEGPDEVEKTMDQLALLRPDSITVHSLALKRAARLNLMKDIYQDISFVNSQAVMNMTVRKCEEAGLFPYYLYRQKNMAGNFENVGYAAPGREGLYNVLIMEEVQNILALGAGASTKVLGDNGRIDRIENVKDISNYIERIDEMIARKRRIPEMMGGAAAKRHGGEKNG